AGFSTLMKCSICSLLLSSPVPPPRGRQRDRSSRRGGRRCPRRMNGACKSLATQSRIKLPKARPCGEKAFTCSPPRPSCPSGSPPSPSRGEGKGCTTSPLRHCCPSPLEGEGGRVAAG